MVGVSSAPDEQLPVRVTGEPGTRLEQLHAAHEQAKADAAAADLKALTDALKAELSAYVTSGPGRPQVDLVPPAGAGYRPLRLSYVESWRVDARKLKAEDPETYVRYAKKSGAWVLKALAGGERE